MVVGSYKNKNCKGIIIRMEKKNRQIPRIVQLTTLTDVVEIPPTIG
jgi:ribosomal protein L39E